MNNKYTDKQLKRKFGLRKVNGIILDQPPELGYRCPKGHSYITWSEFIDHIWCYRCKKDYHYADDCVLVLDKHNPKNLPKQPKIIDQMQNWDIFGENFHDIPKELFELNNLK